MRLREGFCCTPRLIFPIRRDSGINQKEIKLEIILPDGNEARLKIRSQNKAFENIEHGNSPYFCSHYMMPSTAYLAHPRPISLYSVLDASTSMTPTPTLDLDWEPFQAHIEAFLNAVREHAAPLSFSQL